MNQPHLCARGEFFQIRANRRGVQAPIGVANPLTSLAPKGSNFRA